MLSIITAIHNKLEHNKVFFESLVKYTYYSFELIIVDNASTDGSKEFFEKNGAIVIRNEKNVCYPESMNSGARCSKNKYLCFLNNDIYLSKNWDRYIIDAMEKNDIKVASPSGIEKICDIDLREKLFDRWYAIGLKKHVHSDYKNLKRLLEKMYGDWEKFTEDIYKRFYPQIAPGIYGCAVVIDRDFFSQLGGFDIRLQEADWDLTLTTEELKRNGKIKNGVMTVCYSFIHHFIRATLKSKPSPFECNHERLSIGEKWGHKINELWPVKYEVEKPPFFKHQYRKIKRNLMRVFYNIL